MLLSAEAAKTRRYIRLMRSAACLTLILFCLCSTARATAAATPTRPTPAGWEQWQPEQDSSDPRLERRSATVWEEEIALSDLLGRIGEASGVALTAEPELLDTRLSVFAEDCTPAGLMVALAGLLEGYWLYPREQVGQARTYRLIPAALPGNAKSEWVSLRLAARRELLEEDREAYEARLNLYSQALKLSPEEVLARYEESDPWLCADVLNPSLRPLLEQVCGLSEAEREELLSTSSYGRPLRSFDPAFRAELRRLVTELPASGYDDFIIQQQTFLVSPYRSNPDRLPRFATPEDRWDNAVVWFRRFGAGVDFALDVPDTGLVSGGGVQLPRTSPAHARFLLTQFGYREWTREYHQALLAEQERWQESNPQWVGPPRHESQIMAEALASELNLEDMRLKRKLDLGALAGGDPSVPAVLEHVSRQCDLAVLAHCLPAEKVRFLLPDADSTGEDKVTLGALLGALRSGDPAWAWRFYGRYLTVRHTDYPTIEARRIPDDLRAELTAKLRPGARLSLDEAAALLSRLSFVQVCELQDQLGLSWGDTPLWQWRQYGLVNETVDEKQRQALTSSRGLPLTALGTELQKELLREAQARRPWVESGDLSSAAIRMIPRTFSTGEEGVSLIVEYHFPDSPRDRDIFFTSSLQVTVQGY